MLGLRQRRLADIVEMLYKCFVIAGEKASPVASFHLEPVTSTFHISDLSPSTVVTLQNFTFTYVYKD